MQALRSAVTNAAIRHWNAGAGVLPWTAIALDLVKRTRRNPIRAGRGLALLHAAINDAIVAAWDAKEAYFRERPAVVEPAILQQGPIAPGVSTFPSEQAAIAGAASTVLIYLFPEETIERINAQASDAANTCLQAGANYRSDMVAGLALGRAVGQYAVTRGQADGSDLEWDDTRLHKGEGYWVPTPPRYIPYPLEPAAGTWRPWAVHDVAALRPPPPPAWGSATWLGIQRLALLPANATGAATISWSIALVDIDLDGKLDLVHADDQGAILIAKYGGIDRGFIHVFRNDGTGKFTDVTPAVRMNRQGQWMGLAFGDLNCDGQMDLFGSNFGDWALTNFPIPHEVGDFSSRWFLGRADGTFSDPGVGALKATPFGWGVSMADYDNDGDTDIISYGGLDVGPYVEAGNPGTIYQNQDCTAAFKYDSAALAGSTNHRRRTVQGLATGDLNGDGFVDIVTVSNADYPEPIPLARYAAEYGSPFDSLASFVPTFRPVAQGEFAWNGFQATDGTLSVEINSGGNGNSWAAVKLRGSVGTIEGARAPRDGIGAVVFFTPEGGKTVMRPVMGGGSYASQDSLEGTFGLGPATEGMIEVLWPGGARNRLYNVQRSEQITFPEIPCSYTASWPSAESYRTCVDNALNGLMEKRTLRQPDGARLRESALRAFMEH